MADGVKTLTLRVYGEEGGFEDVRISAGPGKYFTEEGVEKAKTEFAGTLESAFPGRYFRFVRVEKNRVNVIPA